MKPNVTIRIACPGSQDVAAETYTGPTINLLVTIHEEYNLREQIHAICRMSLPEYILSAFNAMISSDHANRIEIMEGITMYSCYRHPRSEGISKEEKEYNAVQIKSGAGSQPAQAWDEKEFRSKYGARPRDYSLTSSERVELCFQTCPGRSICTKGTCGPDCPQEWPEVSKVCFQDCEDLAKLRDQDGNGPKHCLDCPMKDLDEDKFIVNVSGEENKGVPCKGHCPQKHVCAQADRCLADPFPTKGLSSIT
jgi:hypothetical protein